MRFAIPPYVLCQISRLHSLADQSAFGGGLQLQTMLTQCRRNSSCKAVLRQGAGVIRFTIFKLYHGEPRRDIISCTFWRLRIKLHNLRGCKVCWQFRYGIFAREQQHDTFAQRLSDSNFVGRPT